MKLRGIEFGNVWNASGARGFFGEGYWFHKLFRYFGLNYTGATFVAKTTTLHKRDGNMPLQEDYTPIETLPHCIKVRPFKGIALNSVGLSGPGIEELLPIWKGQNWDRPWFISIMSVQASKMERLTEIQQMVNLLKRSAIPCGLQVNLSCPNAGLDPSELACEAQQVLDITSALRQPTVLKLNALFPVETAKAATEHPGCDGLIVSNTIPWGKLPDRIDWKGLWGTDVSPLAKLGGGGLSGKPLLPIVVDWIIEAREAGITKPIIGGGGILSKSDAVAMLMAGAQGIELGSVAFLRPWRVASIIKHVLRGPLPI